MTKIICPVCGAELEIEQEYKVTATGGDEPVVDGIGFDELLSEMNTVLKKFNFKPVEEKTTPEIYNLLFTADDLAREIWGIPGHWLFSKELYKEIVDWHGDNKSYKREAYNSLLAWTMASFLAELCPTSGEKTNCQTELYKLAYGLGGGRAVPLYGLDLHCDPMIARSAGSAIYVMLMKINYTRPHFNKLRSELGSSPIPASKWSELGFKGKENVMNGMEYLGYLVNTDAIIPSAPGLYADGCADRVKPWEQGQPSDQFANTNYKMDTAIDDYMVNNFNMGAQTPQSTWDGYSDEKRQRILEAVAASRANDNFFFGSKLIKFDGVHDGTRLGLFTNYTYYWFSESAQNGSGVYRIAGPFADLYDKMLTGGGYGTPTETLKYFNNIMQIADNSRYPTFLNQYGRRRPCGGTAGDKGSARSPINGSPLNALYNIDVSCIFADDATTANKWAKEDGFVTEKPKSYPSGHTTQTWLVALMLGQMTGDEAQLKKYMTSAYQVGVSRTIARFHWTSDVIYGRLIATMCLPVINAMSGLFDAYDKACNVINGTAPEPSGKTPGTVITFDFRIRNNKSQAVTIDDKVNFVMANPDRNGFYYGANADGSAYKGFYNRWSLALTGNGGKITIPAGGEKTFSLRPIAYSNIFNQDGTPYGSDVANGFGGRNLVSKADLDKNGWNPSRGYSNVLLYVDGDSDKVVPDFMDASVVFEQGKTYTATIK